MGGNNEAVSTAVNGNANKLKIGTGGMMDIGIQLPPSSERVDGREHVHKSSGPKDSEYKHKYTSEERRWTQNSRETDPS